MVRCSFCGKREDQLAGIVRGPRVAICDECVERATEILRSRLAAAKNGEPPRDQAATVEQTRATLMEKLAALDPRSRAIFEYRFGLDEGQRVHSLAETTRQFAVSRQYLVSLERRFVSSLQPKK